MLFLMTIYNFLLFAIEWNVQTLQQLGLLAAAVVFALWLWKSGIPQKMSSGYRDLEKLRTDERNNARTELEKSNQEIRDLKEEVRLLRRESLQRLEINLQDQLTIRELREKNRKSEGD